MVVWDTISSWQKGRQQLGAGSSLFRYRGHHLQSVVAISRLLQGGLSGWGPCFRNWCWSPATVAGTMWFVSREIIFLGFQACRNNNKANKEKKIARCFTNATCVVFYSVLSGHHYTVPRHKVMPWLLTTWALISTEWFHWV